MTHDETTVARRAQGDPDVPVTDPGIEPHVERYTDSDPKVAEYARVMEELFVMVMLVNIDHLSGGINGLSQSMNELGEEKNLKIHVMHEDIFNSMHRI